MQIQQQQQQQQQPVPAQKSTKKSGSKALKIINPATGKSIFDDDSSSVSVDQEKSDQKEEIEKENSEPLTPVVSAMSDGPTVDITPKHTVKNKKSKPPENLISQLSDPPKKVEIVESVEVSQDSENNNGSETTVTPPVVVTVEEKTSSVAPVEVIEEEKEAQESRVVVDSNDTNNNNYQKAESDEIEREKETPEKVREERFLENFRSFFRNLKTSKIP